MTTATAFPLTWPQQFPRTKHRSGGSFKTALSAAIKNVQDSLRLFGVDSGKKTESVVISSNVTLGVNRPADPGVAVWFTWDGLQVCIPVDRYDSVQANLQAIHHILEARRVELRHGTLALVRATFTGFKALPSPAADQWRNVLGVEPGESDLKKIEEAYKRLRSAAHPDRKGGDHTEFNRVQLAWEQAQQELRS
jgi:hypothetical protein